MSTAAAPAEPNPPHDGQVVLPEQGPAAALRRPTIRTHLLRLMLALGLPLVALQAWTIYEGAQEDFERAREQVIRLAELTASETARFLVSAQDVLTALAARPAVRALDSAHCDPVLKDFHQISPRFSNVVTMTMDATIVCSSQPLVRPARGSPDRLIKLLRGPPQLTLGKPAPGVITGKWILPLGMALLDEKGGFAGAVILAMDLANFPVLPSVESLPAGLMVGIVSGDGTVLASSGDVQRLIGSNQSSRPIIRQALQERRGSSQETGLDGMARIQAFAPVPGTDWIVGASLPTEAVYAGVKERILTSSLLELAILAVALLLAVRLSRRMALPIDALANAADRVASGHSDAHLPVVGVAEMAAVATRFNAMLDALERSDLERGRLQQVVEQTSDLIAIADQDGALLYVNRACRPLFGLRPEDSIAGLNVKTVHSPERWKFLREVARPHAAKHGFWADESFLQAADGRSIPVSQVLVALKNARGEVDCFAGISRDISAIRQAEAALHQSEQGFRNLAAASPVGIYRTDRQGYVTYVNLRWCEISGASESESQGQGWSRTVLADRERLLAEIRAGVKTRRRFESEFRFERPDGSVVWVLANAVPEFDAAGKFIGYIGTVTDISARKQDEEKLAQQLHELRRWYAATLGREDRVQTLKREVNELRQRLGEAPRYGLAPGEAENVAGGPPPATA